MLFVIAVFIFSLVSLPQATSYNCDYYLLPERNKLIKILDIINQERATRGSPNHRHALTFVYDAEFLAWSKILDRHFNVTTCPEHPAYGWTSCCPSTMMNSISVSPDCPSKMMLMYDFREEPGMSIGCASQAPALTQDNLETQLPALLSLPDYNFILGNVDQPSLPELPPYKHIGFAIRGERFSILAIPSTSVHTYKPCFLPSLSPSPPTYGPSATPPTYTDPTYTTKPILPLNPSYFCNSNSTSLLHVQILNAINAERSLRGSANHKNLLTLVSEASHIASLKISDNNFLQTSCSEFPEYSWSQPVSCCPVHPKAKGCASDVMQKIHDIAEPDTYIGVHQTALTRYSFATQLPTLLQKEDFNFILGNVDSRDLVEPPNFNRIGIATNGDRLSIIAIPSISFNSYEVCSYYIAPCRQDLYMIGFAPPNTTPLLVSLVATTAYFSH